MNMNYPDEVWVQITDKVVPHIRPHYYVSNYGRIGSMSTGSFKIMSLVKDSDGYLNINLHLYLNIIDDEGHARRQIVKRVNRMVLMSFYPLPENYENLEVNHINSIRDDNRLCNLEWVTPRENVLHAIKYGNKEIADIRGELNHMAKLSEKDINKLVKLAYTGNYSYAELANMFNVKSSTIRDILIGKAWKHLNLNIPDDILDTIRKNGNNVKNPFTIEEMHEICKFFETEDINDKYMYPNMSDVLSDCFYLLGLNKKYNFKSKKKSLARILNKQIHSEITSKYNYKFIK